MNQKPNQNKSCIKTGIKNETRSRIKRKCIPLKDLKLVFSYIKPYKKDLITAVILVFAECVFEMVIPLLMSDIVDIGVAGHDVGFMLMQGGRMVACALLALLTGLMYARFAARAANGFGAELRLAQYRKLQSYDFSNLDHFSTPSLVTRLTTDVTVMQNAVNGGLRPFVRSPVMLIMGIGMAFILDRKLAMVFVIASPILGTALALIVRKVGPLYNRQQRAVDHVNAKVQEDLTAIRAIKAFVREDYEEQRFDEANRELAEASLSTFKNAVLNQPVFQLIMYTTVICIMWQGGSFILIGSMTVGELTAFLSYVLQVMNSLMMISNVFLMITRSLASAKRIREVLEERPVLHECKDSIKKVESGSIDFEKVSFKYSEEAEKYALSDIDLHIPEGSTVGIIGGTGSAKSSLVQLIPRLYDATEGRVLVGGRDVRDYSISILRDAVGIVLQKNVLFSGTIRENLLWGDPEATDEELWQALRAACADEFVSRMEKGLDTDLGQGGVNVSGGQKQRLCIARTLIKKPKILIFDDSTSAVDTATEARIRKALSELSGVTKITIAQRISSVKEADMIIVMEDGRVRAVGSHRELLAGDEVYREIYESQMKGGDEDGKDI